MLLKNEKVRLGVRSEEGRASKLRRFGRGFSLQAIQLALDQMLLRIPVLAALRVRAEETETGRGLVVERSLHVFRPKRGVGARNPREP